MLSSELESLSVRARAIAQEAAALVREGYRSGVTVQHKGTIDLVTEYDTRSEALIRDRIAECFPTHAVVAEEGDDETPADDTMVWYVDPLDGTTNFAHGHPFFCVSMALYRGAEGLAAVVVAPALDTVWYGARGQGAFRNGVPCRVSVTETLGDALGATGFPYDKWSNPDNNVAEHAAFLRCTHGVRRGGSAAIDLAMVADGTFDFYWEQRLNAWDMAAGALLVLEAGGRLSDYDGAPGDPRRGRLVASNGLLHEGVLSVIKGVRDRG